MNFAKHITRTPLPFDPEVAADLRATLPALPGEVAELLVNTAACSPYLHTAIVQERDWLLPCLEGDPRDGLSSLMTPIDGDMKAGLRQRKRRMAVLTALADLGGVWTLEQVTGALTEFADFALQAGISDLLGAEIRRGKLPGVTDPDDPAGYVMLAMGKMGAFELNYSSDIDLICLFDESRFEPEDWGEARASFVRVTRRLTSLMSDITGEGYVFRTDLRLRPDSGVTPVCMAMSAAERYYESVGRTWERAAHIKARPSAGDLAAGAAYLDRLAPFVWRRHLDYAAIQDAQEMTRKIRSHKGLGSVIALPGHNMKLGRGGIREIEFFAQTGQLIFGGRDPNLRQTGTVPALAALAKRGRITTETAQQLADDYRALREIEHRLQMVQDAQTHSLPQDEAGLQRIAMFQGYSDVALWKAEQMERLARVHHLTEDFLGPQSARSSAGAETAEQRDYVRRWRSYPALRSERALQSFERLKGDLLTRLAKSHRPDESIAVFDGFLAGLPAGVQLFALFEANPQLIDLIVDIAATSPALAQHLSRNSGVFDAVIAGEFFSPWLGCDDLTVELSAMLDAAPDYEAKLDTARRWTKEWHFRVGVHHLRGLIPAEVAGQQYADLAGAVVAALFPVVQAGFTEKHGGPPGAGATVLGMGSLGAERLNAGSDLDLIVIYDAEGVEYSDGRRPLAARVYYARLTQALVTALSVPMAQGRLYEVDMRLRPSGRQGPVATSLEAFQSYQQQEAWTWEHLALTRARPIAGSPELGARVETFRKTLLAAPRAVPKTLTDVTDMRLRLRDARPADGPWDAKRGAGRLQDIELFAQTAALLAGSAARTIPAQLDAATQLGWRSADDIAYLKTAYQAFAGLQTVSRLLSTDAFAPDTVGAGGVAVLLREMAQTDLKALETHLDGFARGADDIITDGLAQAPQRKD